MKTVEIKLNDNWNGHTRYWVQVVRFGSWYWLLNGNRSGEFLKYRL